MKLFVLALDGLPHSLVHKAFEHGHMPNFHRLAAQGSLIPLNSVIPVVSSVAWATFSTGVNPARHGIFGFVDRDEQLNYVIMTSAYLKAKSLWRELQERSRRVIAINVPTTYPPEPIDGVIVGDFLAPSLERAAHPQSLVPLLKELDYIIDPDPKLAHRDKAAFLEELFRALEARAKLAFQLMEQKWDFFMLHIMETDRLHHFFWEAQNDPGHPYHRDFWAFYKSLDGLIAHLVNSLNEDTQLMILSDHGFCGIRHEVDLNRYLGDLGYLRFPKGAEALSDLEPSSVAYSLTPGRIYCNAIQVAPELLEELIEGLYELRDPETGQQVIQKVYRREEIYHGPLLFQAPDLIAQPADGYDLKAAVPPGSLFTQSARTGMHTYGGAFLYVRGHQLKEDHERSIIDVTPTLYELMRLLPPSSLEGRSLII